LTYGGDGAACGFPQRGAGDHGAGRARVDSLPTFQRSAFARGANLPLDKARTVVRQGRFSAILFFFTISNRVTLSYSWLRPAMIRIRVHKEMQTVPGMDIRKMQHCDRRPESWSPLSGHRGCLIQAPAAKGKCRNCDKGRGRRRKNEQVAD
jgi:hypothetical protein